VLDFVSRLVLVSLYTLLLLCLFWEFLRVALCSDDAEWRLILFLFSAEETAIMVFGNGKSF